MTTLLSRECADSQTAELRTGDEYLELTPDWWALWEQMPVRTPFESPAWVLEWLRTFGRGFRTHILAMRARGELLGVLPLASRKGSQVFSLAGAGISDYLGGCFHPRNPDAPAEMLARVSPWCDGACRLELDRLHTESPLLRAEPASFTSAPLESSDSCAVATLPGDMDAVYARMPNAFREDLHGKLRRARRETEFQVEAAGESTCQDFLDTLFTLRAPTGDQHRCKGVLRDPELQAFHRAVAARFARRGILRLYLLRLNGEVAAGFYGFCCGQTTYYYLGGVNVAFAMFSPESLLMDHAIGQSIADGCTRFDFLRRSEPYKSNWTALKTPTYRRVLTHSWRD